MAWEKTRADDGNGEREGGRSTSYGKQRDEGGHGIVVTPPNRIPRNEKMISDRKAV